MMDVSEICIQISDKTDRSLDRVTLEIALKRQVLESPKLMPR